MNPGGGAGWDESPLGIQIPDDARELDRDVLAYHRELRAKRRRSWLRRLAGPLAGQGTVMPLLASILAVCLVAGAMLSVATFNPATPADRTHPAATATATSPRARATASAATAPQALPATAPANGTARATGTGSASARATGTGTPRATATGTPRPTGAAINPATPSASAAHG